jgi:hypothetical protein
MFLFTTASRPVLGPTQPPIQWVSAAVSPEGKAAGAWSWPLLSSAEVKNAWSYTSTPQYAFMVWCSVTKKTRLPITPGVRFKMCNSPYDHAFSLSWTVRHDHHGTQPSLQWVASILSLGGKETRAWSWPLTSTLRLALCSFTSTYIPWWHRA